MFNSVLTDILKEHIRSRMIYFYILTAVVIIGAVLNIVLLQVDREVKAESLAVDYKFPINVLYEESKWFSNFIRKSPEEHYARLKKSTEVVDGDLEPGIPIPGPSTFNPVTESNLFVSSTPDNVPVWVFEMPESNVCCVVVHSAGGVLEETEENAGKTDLVCRLINDHLIYNPSKYPLIQYPAAFNPRGIWLSTTVLADRLPSVLSSLSSLMEDPPLDPSQRQHMALFDLKHAIAERRYSAINRARDLAMSRLLPGHRMSAKPLGDPKHITQMDHKNLTEHFHSLFSPGRLGFIVSGPYAGSDIVDLITQTFTNLLGKPPTSPEYIHVDLQPGTGITSETSYRNKTAAIACSLLPRIPNKGSLDPRFNLLYRNLKMGLHYKLREEGLIYAYVMEDPVPVQNTEACVSVFACSGSKEPRVLNRVQTWISGFPGSLEDRDLSAAASRLFRTCTQYTGKPQMAALHLLTQYMQKNRVPVHLQDEAEMWRDLKPPEIRNILESYGLSYDISLVSLKPGTL